MSAGAHANGRAPLSRRGFLAAGGAAITGGAAALGGALPRLALAQRGARPRSPTRSQVRTSH